MKIIPLLILGFLLGLGAPEAGASLLTYQINFNAGPNGTPTGSFTYDTTVPTFTSFVVNYHGESINMLAGGLNPNNPLMSLSTPCAHGETALLESFRR